MTIKNIEEVTALGVICLVFLGLGTAVWKVILPRFFDSLEKREFHSNKVIQEMIDSFKSSAHENSKAIAEVHEKVDSTLKSVMVDMKDALAENGRTTSELIRQNQKFTLELIHEIAGKSDKSIKNGESK